MTTVRTAVLQFQSVPGDITNNINQSLLFLQQAADRGVKLAVLPELCQSGYDLTPELAREVAEPVDGKSVNSWKNFAMENDMYIVGGLCEADGDKIYNSAVLVGPKGYIGVYRKAHLFSEENVIFSQGNNGFPVFDLGWGKISILICYDLRFPEAIRMLALQGTDIVCVPTAWVMPQGQKWDNNRASIQAYCAMAHASMNRMYIACANTYGSNTGSHFLGGSIIAGPRGWPVAGPASTEESALLIADLNLEEARRKKQNPYNHVLNDRRVDIYGEISIKVK
ncbi:nitrilase-related carbon-nitrogen hydrolase [Bacillus sp. B15-48]|uniref:nitrilase-related carbon-nitrogen hydrolase n=1 Tax=Bacillus sp. B15-48 TaxID=1548601 RepID=UPI00193FBCBA|nr:nitrilase-related carbon-nitrogen hydrolase [Bacillus sp. B15-48]MBM4765036.1 hydratase [Bacillus sp. B15-48]